MQFYNIKEFFLTKSISCQDLLYTFFDRCKKAKKISIKRFLKIT